MTTESRQFHCSAEAARLVPGTALSKRSKVRAQKRLLDHQAVIYRLLFKAASETMLTIAALCRARHKPPIPSTSAQVGITAVLHTWGSAMTQNPHSRYRALSSP